MRRTLALLIMLLMLLQGVGTYAAPSAESYNKEAQALINEGKYEDALKKLDEAIKLAPRTPAYYIAKGSLLTRMSMGTEAITCYDRAFDIINKYPNAANKAYLDELFLERGLAYISLYKYYEATICYDRAITYNASNIRAYVEKAKALHMLDRHADEVLCLDKAIEKEPGNDSLYFMKGEALIEQEKYGEALAVYDRLIQLKPDNAEAYYKKSISAALTNNPRAMIEALKKAVSLDNKYAALARNEGRFSKYVLLSEFIDIAGIVNEYGNTHGNIHSSGSVAVQGEWIYYSYKQNGLWKEKLDGSSRQKICDESASMMNVVGDWIYCNLAEDPQYGDYKFLGFYKLKTDGSERIKLYDKYIESVNVVGEWIYYVSEEEACKPFKMKTDGTERVHLAVTPARCLTVSGDWIYYQNGADRSCLYRMNLNGKKVQKVSDVNAYRLDINVSGDYVYVTGMYSYKGLYKMKKDGSGSVRLLEDHVSSLNVDGEWIYYTIYEDGIYRMKTDGTQKQKLHSGDVFALSLAGDWIYFGKWKEGEAIERDGYYKMKKDGSGIQTIKKY